MGFVRPGGGPMGFQGWLKVRLLLLLVFLCVVVACSEEEPQVVTVFVPTAVPLEAVTGTPVPTPTFAPQVLRDYAAFCDDQLRVALLEIKGPWNLGEVWDYAIQQVDDCSAEYWEPAPGADEGLELVSVAGVELFDDLRYRNGRGVNGSVRVSFAEGRPGGDGYYHWYFDPFTARWYSGDYVEEQHEAAPRLADLPLDIQARFAEVCWTVLETSLAYSFSRGGKMDRDVAARAVTQVQRGTWRCASEIWSPLAVDAGQMDDFCGYDLPLALRAGPGVSGDGSFRMDFRDDLGSTRPLVYLSVGGNDSDGFRERGYLPCG